MTTSPAMVEVSAVSKRYHATAAPAVDSVNLQIPRGSIYGLLGPNGAGKTTLLSMICGLLQPDQGQIAIQGLDIGAHGTQVKSHLGLVPQELALYPKLSARENLGFFASMQGLRGAAREHSIHEALAVAKLEAVAQQRVETYSGGLKRRLNLAIGLLHKPALLILDEPTVGIDPQSRNFIHQSLRKLNDAGMTIIYTTHYMEEVEQLCDEIAIIDHGHIITQGSLEGLLGSHQGGNLHLRLRQAPAASIESQLKAIAGLDQVTVNGSGLSLHSADAAKALTEVLAVMQQHKQEIVSLSMGATNLEQLFLQLTGSRLRD